MTEDRKEKLDRWKKRERIVLLPILILVVAAFFMVARVEVLGHSMDPTLHDGQRLLVLRQYKLLGPLKVGDVIVIEPGRGKSRDAQIIKRVAFIQNAEGTLPWPEKLPTSHGPVATGALFEGATTGSPVQKEGILVLGDNLENSTDSRDFGPVFAHEIYGKALLP